jgi:hypothetical protein
VNETSYFVRNQISDTIAAVASVTLFKDTWPQLVPWIFSLSESPNEHLRVLSSLLVNKLSEQMS